MEIIHINLNILIKKIIITTHLINLKMEVEATSNNFQIHLLEMIFLIIKCSNWKVDFRVEVLQMWLPNSQKIILKVNKWQNLSLVIQIIWEHFRQIHIINNLVKNLHFIDSINKNIWIYAKLTIYLYFYFFYCNLLFKFIILFYFVFILFHNFVLKFWILIFYFFTIIMILL